MSQLLAAIANRQSQTGERAHRRYVEILLAEESALADELLEVLETLGKTEKDVASDLRVIAEYRQIRQNIREGEAALKPEDLKAAKQRLEDFDVETYRLERRGEFDSERVWGRQKLQLEVNRLEAQGNANIGNNNRLYELSRKHRLLLAGI